MSLRDLIKQKKVQVFTVLFLFLILGLSFNKSLAKIFLHYKYHNWIKKIPQELELTEYISVVVLSKQRNYIFINGEFYKYYVIATGSKKRYPEDRTLREGVWRLGKRLDKGLKPLYGPRLIFMEYYNSYKKEFIETKKAFHGTDEPQILGKPLSMGCVYHSNEDIIELYDYLPAETLVITTKY